MIMEPMLVLHAFVWYTFIHSIPAFHKTSSPTRHLLQLIGVVLFFLGGGGGVGARQWHLQHIIEINQTICKINNNELFG